MPSIVGRACLWSLIAAAVGCTSDSSTKRDGAEARRGSERARDSSDADGNADASGPSRDSGPRRASSASGANDAEAPRDAGEERASSDASHAAAGNGVRGEEVGGDTRGTGGDATDASAPNTPTMDAAADGGTEPAPSSDAGVSAEPPLSCAPFVMPSDCVTNANSVLPTSLHCAGLYANIVRHQLSCGLVEYAPAYELWSDGAVKRRWVSLPAGATVDTRDPDGFVFPVGTEFWKEFQVSQNGALRRAETRLLRKVERGWVLATYVWSEDGRSATSTNGGVANWAGSGHTVPSRDECVECHAGRKDLVLGWDPVLLGPGARGVHLEDLVAASTTDEDAGTLPLRGATPPGDAIEQAALGYLHVNCGVSCHNNSIEARARDTALYLRLETGNIAGVLESPAVTTAINKLPTGNAPFFELPAPDAGPFYDLLPGSPERSLLLARMLVRDHPAQMPPLASNVVDELGTAAVAAWIQQMTQERGYPAPAP